MKAQSVSLTLYHFAEGRHREVCLWHDQDHRPEVLGMMPHLFLSERWVVPPELRSASTVSTLPHDGGEYVNLYWSSGTADEMATDFGVLVPRLERLGRMAPMRYIERAWGRRLRPMSVSTRTGFPLSAEVLPCAPQNTGLLVVIGELAPGASGDAYARWHAAEHVPLMLETGVFSGAVKLVSADADDANLWVVLFYSDHPDPTAAYQEYCVRRAEWAPYPNVERAFQLVHHAMYRPSVGRYDAYP